MPKRKNPLPAPLYEWVDGKMSVGQIVLAMAHALYADREELIRAPKTNQLGAMLELDTRENQFVAQVNAAFAEMNAYQTRQAKAGAVNTRVNGNPTASIVKQLHDALTARGKKVTAPAVEAEWRKPANQKRGFGQPVTHQAIRTHLRKLKTKAP